MAAKDFELILRVQADLQQAVSQLRTLNDQMRVTKSAAVEASGGISQLSTSARAAETGVRGVGTQLTGLNAKFASVNRAAHDLRNAFVFAFAAHEVVQFTGAMVEANVEAQRIQNTMEQAFGKDGAQQQLQFVRDLSQKLGLDFKSAAEGFAQLGASAQGTGIQTSDLRKLFTGLSSAATVLHSSTQDVNGVMIQLGQAMSLGKLQMQDIRAIAQHLPGTMTTLTETAKRMGTTLTAALKSGGLEAKQFIGILGDVLQERFGEQAKTASHSLNSELNRLHGTLFELQTDGTGFADTFATAIDDLDKELNDPGVRAGLQNIISGIGTVTSEAIKAAAKIGEFLKAIRNLSEIAAFRNTDSVQSDAGYQAALGRLDADKSQLDKRENGNFFQRHGLFQSAPLLSDEYHAQRLSVEQLREEIAKLTTETKNYRDASKPTASNPQEGDNRGLYGVGIPKPGAPTKPDTAALRKAAELARQAAQAQNALSQSLINLQGQLDPTAAVYAKYNEAVKKATDQSELAKKAKGADAAAIDSQRDAVIALAGTIRDAALDQIAEKDRQAWEALKRSFETPAQVAVDDALKKITQLNELLKKGTISSAEYHGALARIGASSVTAAPQYQGPDAVVSGAFGELQKNSKALADLEAWHATVLAANAAFNAKDAAQEEAHKARMAAIDKTYSAQKASIESARGTLTLQAAEEGFGQLAALTSSSNKKLAAIGRVAAIVQAGLSLAINVSKASEAGFPLNLGFIAGAIAQGAQIMSLISAAGGGDSGGYSDGGMTPPGGKYQVAGVVHAGEGVLSQQDISALGGPAGFHALRSSLHGFADGGFVNPLRNAPSPAAMGFAQPAALPIGAIAASAARGANDGAARGPGVGVRIVNSIDPEFATSAMNSPAGEKVIMNVLSRNSVKLKQMVR